MVSSFGHRLRILIAALFFPVMGSTVASTAPDYTVQAQTIVLPSGDYADVYAPEIPYNLRSELAGAFPLIVFLQGANVDKSNYSKFAQRVAAEGFVIVIPNHYRAVPGLAATPGLYAEVGEVTDVLEGITAEDMDPSSTLAGIVDLERMGVSGHSLGGAVGVDAAAGVCEFPLCTGSYTRPAALQAAIFYGTNEINPATGTLIERDTSGVAVALVQGTDDGVAAPAAADSTLPTLALPHGLISVAGTNHYGICNTNNPSGATPDPNVPAVRQPASFDTIARWVGLWFKTNLSARHDAS
jgi:predicted dienelactone hydrolase